MKKLNVGELSVKLGMDDKEFQKGMGGAEKSMRKLADGMGAWGKTMTKRVTLPIVGLFAGMAKASMSLEATEAKYKTVFEGMTDVSDSFINKFKELTPATTAEARTMASGIQDLLIPMGFFRDEATNLTGELFHVIGALTNFNSGSHTAEEVTRAVSSALVGQYEPLKRLGINTNKGAVNQKALAMGLADTEEALTDQHRALALTEIIYENSTDALTAYTEENLDAKTKLGLLKAQVVDSAGAFGTHFLPMIHRAIDGARDFVKYLDALDETQQKMILTVMAVVASIGPLLLVGSKLINSFLLVKTTLMAISAPALIVIGVIMALVATFVHLWRTNEEFRDKVIAVWGRIQEYIPIVVQQIQEVVKVGMEKIKAGFEIVQGVIENVFIPIIIHLYDIFQTVFPKIKDFVNEAMLVVTAVLHDVNEIINNFVIPSIEFLYQIFQNNFPQIKDIVVRAITVIKEVLETVMDVIKQVVSTVNEWVTENRVKIMMIQLQFSRFMEKIMEIMGIIMDLIEIAWKFIAGIWKKYGDQIMNIVKVAFDTIAGVIRGVMKVINGILDVFIGIFTGDWQRFNDGATQIWSGMWDTIKSILSGIWGVLKTIFGGLLTNIINWFNGLRDDAKKKVGELVKGFADTIRKAWSTLKGAFGILLIRITSWFKSLPRQALKWGKNLITGFTDGIKSMAGNVASAVKGTIGNVADFLKFWSPAKKGEGRHIVKWGANMIDGFIDGMKSMTPELQKVVGGIIPTISPSIAGIGSVGKSPVTTNNNSNTSITNLFKIGSMVIREEADIEKVSRELFRMQDKGRRGPN